MSELFRGFFHGSSSGLLQNDDMQFSFLSLLHISLALYTPFVQRDARPPVGARVQ